MILMVIAGLANAGARGSQPTNASVLESLRRLQRETLGDPEICVAVLDGPVDLSHPCFRDANLQRLSTLVDDPAGGGPMSVHGTHVASVVFGQPNTPLVGIAARCRGLVVPIFRDDQEGYLSQLDLARAIEQAVQAGAHVINVSGGEPSPSGQVVPALGRALKLCADSNVLVVAAAGNDGCDCLQVPAAVPSVLAVGAMTSAGGPVQSSNWGAAYRSNGVLAPGEAIRGAVPGGGTAELTGSSFATPIVAGLAGLLLSTQLRRGQDPDPRRVREAILSSAVPCEPRDAAECAQYLVGTLNVSGAYAFITRGGRIRMGEHDVGVTSPSPENAAFAGQSTAAGSASAGIEPSAASIPSEVVGDGDASPPSEAPDPPSASELGDAQPHESGLRPSGAEAPPASTDEPSDAQSDPVRSSTGVRPASECGCNDSAAKANIFAIGNIGFDFGTEARRDTFRQLMQSPPPSAESPPVYYAPNAYDPRQLADYLDAHPSESTKLIWTLTLDLTPVYAVEAEVAYAEEVYQQLRVALRNQALSPEESKDYVSRVSIAGRLTTRTRRLFSGQVVPVVVAQPRGLYTWNETIFVDAVLEAVRDQAVNQSPPAAPPDPTFTRRMLRSFLDKAYYELRNLGQSSPDRAINFAATNAFLFGTEISRGILSPMAQPEATNRFMLTSTGQIERAQPTLGTLDTITATKSAYCRVDSDCWDVQITFFDPENSFRARTVFLMTIDVSDELPVTLAPTHQFLVAR